MIADDRNTGGRPTIASSSVPVTSLAGNNFAPDSDFGRHFATDHLLTNLKGRTVSSGFVTGGAQLAQFGLNLVSIAILARLLTPGDFGLVAMVTTIMGFLRIFNDAGLSTATVQREGITHAQVSNLFWTNVALGGLVSVALAACAPAVAWFYREPRLVGVTLALAITFLLTSSAVQHLALLKRQMHFKRMAVIQVSSMAAGVLVGIGMAWLNFGYWSLVGMQLSTPTVSFLLTWWLSRWRPQWPTRHSGTRSLLNFGANLSASSFLWCLARGSDGLLLGRFYGSVPLGLYSRAAALVSRPVEQFMSPLEAVFLPTLSRLQAHPERYRRVVLEVYEVIAITSFPLSALLLPLSHPFTRVLLGQKWESAAPIFAAFTLVALYTPIAGITGWLLTSQCRGRDFLLQSIIGSSVTVLAFLVGLPFGPAGVALSYSLSSLLILLPVLYYIAGRQGPVTTMDLWSRFFKHLPLWCVVCGATFSLYRLVPNFSPLLQLLVCGSGGLLVGAIFISVYPPARRTMLHLFSVLRDWREAGQGASSEME
jgi:O-antigen/teichoic acid export membrane protein